MVFITPKILRNAEDNAQIVDSKINERIDFDTAAIIADEFGWQAIEVVGENIIALKEKTDKKREKNVHSPKLCITAK